MTISAKSFSILTIGFREDVLSFYIGALRKLATSPGGYVFRWIKLVLAIFV